MCVCACTGLDVCVCVCVQGWAGDWKSVCTCNYEAGITGMNSTGLVVCVRVYMSKKVHV